MRTFMFCLCRFIFSWQCWTCSRLKRCPADIFVFLSHRQIPLQTSRTHLELISDKLPWRQVRQQNDDFLDLTHSSSVVTCKYLMNICNWNKNDTDINVLSSFLTQFDTPCWVFTFLPVYPAAAEGTAKTEKYIWFLLLISYLCSSNMQFENSPPCRSEQSAFSPLVTFALATFQSTNPGMKLQ